MPRGVQNQHTPKSKKPPKGSVYCGVGIAEQFGLIEAQRRVADRYIYSFPNMRYHGHYPPYEGR